MSGLRGTGSFDWTVRDFFLSERRTTLHAGVPLDNQWGHWPGITYALPAPAWVGPHQCAVITGLARAGIDALVELAADKTPRGRTGRLCDNPQVQDAVGRADAILNSGRLYRNAMIAELWNALADGRETTLEQRARCRLAAVHAGDCARQAMDLMFRHGGSTSFKTASCLAEVWRDLQVVGQAATSLRSGIRSAAAPSSGSTPARGCASRPRAGWSRRGTTAVSPLLQRPAASLHCGPASIGGSIEGIRALGRSAQATAFDASRLAERQAIAGYEDVRRNVTPLAAVVFDRAAPSRASIPQVMADLRNDLAPLRDRLRDAEEPTIGGSIHDEIVARGKWKSVFEEIEKTYGQGEGLLTVRQLLDFAKITSALVDEVHKTSSWAKALLSLPADMITRLLARGPSIEIFDREQEIPSSTRLLKKASDLFGEIKFTSAALRNRHN